ncbi:RND transporter [Chryseobacterium sp. Leaf180]|uniref:efflux RND transporter periplasmic adaptor subunit n=1 Tax=Chryseobacterium sp. Leaf180 TaxID=1736289 RepID=UPI0006F527A2|nr:efflux RND transporter periplasmic adaptor subunit [Chryseobacterium sp. Leaf180]KQR93706.1 RND transporter [Chryseobacterium sp. Leaf180]
MKNIFYAFLAALSICSCSKEEKKTAVQPKGFELSNQMLASIKTAVAEFQNIENSYSFYGKIAVDANSYIDVYPLVGGNVMSVNVELGDYVRKGQVLATIRSTELAEIQKDISDARTDLVVAKNSLRVAREMYEGKLTTEREVLEAKSQVQKAEDQLRRSNAVSAVYNVKNGNIYSVIAPISGYIVHKDINKDMQLRSDRSENIFDVANNKNVWAIMNINESDIDKISIGMPAQVSTLSYPDKNFNGKIDKIFKIINPETNAMQARVVLDNADELLIPDSKATVKVSKSENEKAIAIPSKAVIFDDNRSYVVVFKSRTDVKIREIEVGKQYGDATYIKDGLAEGEKVITNNQLLIYRSLKN